MLLWNGTLILVAIGFSASSSAFSLLFGCLGEARRRGDDDGRRDAETTGSTRVHRRSTFQISQPRFGYPTLSRNSSTALPTRFSRRGLRRRSDPDG